MSEAVRNWKEFINKLEKASSYGIKGFQVPAVCKLIYSGALDTLIDNPPFNKDILGIYNSMFEQVRTTLRSKANIPKRGKTEYIGLSEVRDLSQLSLWRWQSSPIYRFSVADLYAEELRREGFEPFHDPKNPIVRYLHRDPKNPAKNKLIVERWDDIFAMENSRLFDLATNQERDLYMIGFVTDVTRRSYGEKKDKAMLKISVMTGQTNAEGLVLWQERETGDFDPKMKIDLTVGNVCLIKIIPSVRGGFRGGTIKSTRVL